MVCPAIVDEGDHLFDRRSSFPLPLPARPANVFVRRKQPRQNTRSPCVGSHWPAAVLGSRARAPSVSRRHPSVRCLPLPTSVFLAQSTGYGVVNNRFWWRKTALPSYSPSCPNAIRTARARTSGENVFVIWLVMAPSSLEVRASGKLGGGSDAKRRQRSLERSTEAYPVSG